MNGRILDCMPSSNPVFIDTMVMAGVFAISKTGKESAIDEAKKAWKQVIIDLLSSVNLKPFELIVPTSVCHELSSI